MLNSLAYWLTIAPRKRALQRLLPEARIHPAGSRYVCDPPVMNTDIDFLVYSETHINGKLVLGGYKMTSLEEYAHVIDKSKFKCWRRGKVNLIVTHDRPFAEAFQTGTYISRVFNVGAKRTRVVIHGTLRGEDWAFEFANTNPQIVQLLEKFSGPNGNTMHKAYRAQHGLEL